MPLSWNEIKTRAVAGMYVGATLAVALAVAPLAVAPLAVARKKKENEIQS